MYFRARWLFTWYINTENVSVPSRASADSLQKFPFYWELIEGHKGVQGILQKKNFNLGELGETALLQNFKLLSCNSANHTYFQMYAFGIERLWIAKFIEECVDNILCKSFIKVVSVHRLLCTRYGIHYNRHYSPTADRILIHYPPDKKDWI